MLKLTSTDLGKFKLETLAVPVCEDKNIHDNRLVVALIKKVKQIKEFKGRRDDTITLYNLTEINAGRVVLIGLGKLGLLDAEALRTMAGKAVKQCVVKDLSDLMLVVPSARKARLKISTMLEALMEGACLGNHVFDRYKKEKKHHSLKKIACLVTPAVEKKFQTLPSRVETICMGTILAREWVTMPPNHKRPQQLVQSITESAGKAKLTFEVLDENALQRKKFGAILAVAEGSHSKPRLLMMEYRSQGANKTIALVGKGVTFDSGGINLKSSGSLSDMKMDMSGAAAVAATLITTARLKSNINLIGVLPLVENMPSGSAVRPGDIVTSYSGKTVEVENTDAEGRLILIDAISYVMESYKPQILIDVATLTGACVVALGEKIAGVFSPDDQLANAIVGSGEKTHERCWRMPLADDYKPLLDSDLADIKNMSSSRWGGAITAALFLKEFVGGTRWAHIDIAGPAFIKKENAYCGAGGTGFGVRLLCDLLEKL